MPALPPEPTRARRPEQLTLRAAAFVEMLFVAPARARAACRARRAAPRAVGLPPATVVDLLAWRRAEPHAAPPARPLRANGRLEPELRVSRPAPRARVVQPKPLSHEERVELRAIERELRGRFGLPMVKPELRSECKPCASCQEWRDGVTTVRTCDHDAREAVNRSRPCLYASCERNLYLDPLPSGALKLNFAHLEIGEMKRSCAADLADQGGVPLEIVGDALNTSMERARQLVDEALAKGKAVVRAEDVEFEVDEGPGGPRSSWRKVEES